MAANHSDRSFTGGRDRSPGSGRVSRGEAGEAGDDDVRERILRVAAARLSRVPFMTVSLDDVSEDAGLPAASVRELFTDMHGIGSAILDHERSSMRVVQKRLSQQNSDPLDSLVLAFRLVGENLAGDIIVRAGVRMAAESRDFFPERQLDPFRTWEAFVAQHLTLAQEQGLLRADLDLPSSTWIMVAAGMGAKDLIAFHNSWRQAAAKLESTMRSLVKLVSVPARSRYGTA